MKVLALAGDAQAPIAEIRLGAPLRAWAEAERGELRLLDWASCRLQDLAWADVLVVQRPFSPRCWHLQRAMQRRGGAVVVEIDDLLTAVPAHVAHHALLRSRQPWLRRCLQTCELVSVSTAKLGATLQSHLGGHGPAQSHLGGHGPAFAVVPNTCGPVPAGELPAQHPDGIIQLVVAGMDALDCPWFVEALQRLQGQADAHRRWQVHGVGPAGLGLERAGVRLQRHELMPRAAFWAWVRSLDNVVAAIPLPAGEFESCKSAIKWFEFGALGVPVVCSDVSPYAEVVADGRTGLLVPASAASWEQALTGLQGDAQRRSRLAAQARWEVRQHHGAQQAVQAWGGALRQAWALRGQGPAPSWAQQAGQRAWEWQQALLQPWRSWNRARLNRRRQRLAGGDRR